jgi:hypothetical protein
MQNDQNSAATQTAPHHIDDTDNANTTTTTADNSKRSLPQTGSALPLLGLLSLGFLSAGYMAKRTA